LLGLHLAVLAVGSLFLLTVGPLDSVDSVSPIPYCIAFLALVVYMQVTWTLAIGSWLDPYLAFLWAASLFHGGQLALECFGLNPLGLLSGLVPNGLTIRSVLLVLLGFAFLHLGALCGLAFSRDGCSHRPLEFDTVDIAAVRATGWLLLAVSIVPASILLRNALQNAFSGGYFSALFGGVPVTSLQAAPNVLAAFLTPAAMFLLSGSSTNRATRILALAVVSLYSLTYFLIGGRSAATIILISFAWLWHVVVHPLPRKLAITAGLAVVLVFFPLVSLIRGASGIERLSPEAVLTGLKSVNNPAVASLTEMGGSLVTVAYTIQLVPSLREYDMGGSYVLAASTVLPNLFWEIHPGASARSPGHWILKTLDPDTAAMGGGIGYSFIAESYFNFGWFGPVLVMPVLGFLLGRMSRPRGGLCNPAELALAASMLTFLLWMVRNEAWGAARGISWYALGPYICARLLASAIRRAPTGASLRSAFLLRRTT
jgi:oligosaccharide repeat unit polymerase